MNKLLTVIIILIYCVAMLIVIQWGLPNPDRPFPFHMDEWHQLRGVATLAKDYSNNVPGSGHGTMLHFILSGIYLVPFYLLHIIHPANLKHNLSPAALTEYNHIFVLLRIFILMFGVATLYLIYKISDKYIKINPPLSVLLFAATPTWIMWSNYFKYDVPVVFWIVCSILFLLRYQQKPTRKRFLLASIVCGLAFSTKISAIPLLPVLVVAFLLFTPHFKKHLSTFLLGIGSYLITICLVGIPDILLGKGDYTGFINDSIISGPQGSTNMILTPVQTYLPVFQQLQIDFGYGISLLLLISAVYYVIVLVKALQIKKLNLYKTEIFLLSGFIFFLLSLIPLKYFVSSNRIMVLLPFVVFLIMIAIKNIFKKSHRFFLYILLFCVILTQLFQTYAWYSMKLVTDQRIISSQWILKHIPPRSTIGLNNIPIYQVIPDIILKDFYDQQYKTKEKTYYHYIIIDDPKVKLPKYIVITNAQYDSTYLKISVKKTLLIRMAKENYKLVATFVPDFHLISLLGNEQDYALAALIPSWPISIYEKD
jgi:hypothetical protein